MRHCIWSVRGLLRPKLTQTALRFPLTAAPLLFPSPLPYKLTECVPQPCTFMPVAYLYLLCIYIGSINTICHEIFIFVPKFEYFCNGGPHSPVACHFY